jgi:xylulose-5-phosphate/fructose-6-phosphate phosphoketolase
MPNLHNRGGGVREKILNEQIAMKNSAYENGIDPKTIREWKWKY